MEVEVPQYFLDNSVITLQWTWYGGGVYYGDQKAAFAEYVNCSDMTVIGGLDFQPRTPNFAPTFDGGDQSNKETGLCRYWGSNKIGTCPEGFEKGDKNGCGYGEMKNGKPFEFE